MCYANDEWMMSGCHDEPDEDVASIAPVPEVAAAVPEDWDAEAADEPAPEVAAAEPEDWDAEAADEPAPEVAAAEPEDRDAEIAAAPAVMPAGPVDAELSHDEVIDHLLKMPSLQDLAVYKCLMTILEGTRRKLRKTEKQLKNCEKVCFKLYTYSSALETSTTVHYERAKAEYGAHTSMGDQPSTNLCD